MQILRLSFTRVTLLRMIHARTRVAPLLTAPPSLQSSLFSVPPSPAVPDFFFPFFSPPCLSLCSRLPLSVSLEHPRSTVRPRRWTGEDWRFAIAATCSTASKAPKESHGFTDGNRFSPVGRGHSYLPLDTRLCPGLPMGPVWPLSLRQSYAAWSLETGCPGATHLFPTRPRSCAPPLSSLHYFTVSPVMPPQRTDRRPSGLSCKLLSSFVLSFELALISRPPPPTRGCNSISSYDA